MNTTSSDRRPIATREKNWSKSIAGFLANRGVSPNAISVAGMITGILAGVAFAATRFSNWGMVAFVVAAIFVQLRLLANMFDGMVAIQQERTSKLGELFNEIPDRVSDAAILIGAGFAVGGSPTLGYVAACLAIFLAYIRAQGAVAGSLQEFCGPMAKPHRMAAVTLAALFAAFAPGNWQPVFESPNEWSMMACALAVIILGELVTVVRRLSRISRALREPTQ
jgi:phosphatidylglycerophosphate synthase